MGYCWSNCLENDLSMGNTHRSKMSKQQRAEAQKLTSYIERLNRLMEREKTSIQSHPYPTGVTGKEETLSHSQ